MEQICSKCKIDPVFMDGLCEDCYEEQFEDKTQEKSHPKMIVHGASLKDPSLNRSIDKLNKLNRKKYD